MSNKLTVGIDHGYSMMKTPHFAFPAGVEAYDYKPYTDKNSLEYGGTFYVVGSGRQPLQKDKTATEDHYLMTLAAIAKEIDYRNAERTAEVHVAAGLPLTGFGREMEKFRKYLLRDGRPVSFRYEGRDYSVSITDVSMFPQGYAAILTQGELLKEPSVVVGNLGGWTFDLMRLDRRLPDASTCRSLELGVIRCLDEIEEQVRRKTGLSVTTARPARGAVRNPQRCAGSHPPSGREIRPANRFLHDAVRAGRSHDSHHFSRRRRGTGEAVRAGGRGHP